MPLSFVQSANLLKAIKEHNRPIAKAFASDAGVDFRRTIPRSSWPSCADAWPQASPRFPSTTASSAANRMRPSFGLPWKPKWWPTNPDSKSLFP